MLLSNLFESCLSSLIGFPNFILYYYQYKIILYLTTMRGVFYHRAICGVLMILTVDGSMAHLRFRQCFFIFSFVRTAFEADFPR